MEIDLSSVHWTHGMLLSPEHFLRQEKYFDSSMMWMMRYASDAYGLVGAGARGDAGERGASKHDPVINIDDDGELLKISVTQCRGITPVGDIIEIDPSNALHRSFPKSGLEGVIELGIYLINTPHNKLVKDGINDAANPHIKSVRQRQYDIRLDVTAADAPHSIMISRIRKADGTLRFEKSSDFIPVCTTLIGHSALKRAWDELRTSVVSLSERYRQLHKAIVEYMTIAGNRNVSVREDEETLQFVGRMVMSLESGIYDVLDPLQSPQMFFRNLYRVIRSAATYLDLSPPTREYFRQLVEYGVTEFGVLLEQEQKTLTTSRDLSIHDDLGAHLRAVEQSVYRLRRLEEALEGKYMDFRISTALEALQFFFDRRTAPPALYESVARPARPQISGGEMTFIFAPLKLDARQSYRIILIREPNAQFELGEEIGTEIRINEGMGFGFAPIMVKAKCELSDQRNFTIDFDTAKDIHTINDLRIIVNSAWPVKSCLLYSRRRMAQPARMSPQVTPPPPPPAPLPQNTQQYETDPTSPTVRRRRLS